MITAYQWRSTCQNTALKNWRLYGHVFPSIFWQFIRHCQCWSFIACMYVLSVPVCLIACM